MIHQKDQQGADVMTLCRGSGKNIEMDFEIEFGDTKEVKMPDMKIGIMADSHGHPDTITDALAFLAERKCRPILHLGDLCDSAHPETAPACVEPIREYGVTAVKGNNDHAIVANYTDHRQNPVSTETIDFLKSLPLVARFQKAIFTHSLPFHKTLGLSCMIRDLGSREIKKIFAQFSDKIVFRGHSHTPEIIWQQGGHIRTLGLKSGCRVDLAGRMPAVVTCGALTDGFCMIWEPFANRVECQSYR